MKCSSTVMGALSALIFITPAAQADSLVSPVTSTLASETIICAHPESLYLLYEAGTIAMAGGGKDAFQSYFNAAAKVVEARGECEVVAEQKSVEVSGFVLLTNPLRKDDQVLYGMFKLEGGVDRWAMATSLPQFKKHAEDVGIAKARVAEAPAGPEK